MDTTIATGVAAVASAVTRSGAFLVPSLLAAPEGLLEHFDEEASAAKKKSATRDVSSESDILSIPARNALDEGPLLMLRELTQSWETSKMDIKTLFIGALVIAVGVLGYLYYDSQRNQVKVDLPGVKIESH